MTNFGIDVFVFIFSFACIFLKSEKKKLDSLEKIKNHRKLHEK